MEMVDDTMEMVDEPMEGEDHMMEDDEVMYEIKLRNLAFLSRLRCPGGPL